MAEGGPASWIAGVVSTAQESRSVPSSVASAGAAADAAARAAGVPQQSTYYQQPYTATAQYNSAPFGAGNGAGWAQQQQQQQQQTWGGQQVTEEQRVAAWHAYYAQSQNQQQGYQPQQQQWQPAPVSSQSSFTSLPPPPPSAVAPSLALSAAPAGTALTWKQQFELAQQKNRTTAATPNQTQPTAHVTKSQPYNIKQQQQQQQHRQQQQHVQPPPLPSHHHHHQQQQQQQQQQQEQQSAAMGRGRGSVNNMPAWMTAQKTSGGCGSSGPVQAPPSSSAVAAAGSPASKGKRGSSRWGDNGGSDNGNGGGAITATATATTASSASAAVAAAAAQVAAAAARPAEKMTLTTFTEKCMAQCRSPAELDLMRKALHTRITEAISSGEVTKDWALEAPPATGYVQPPLPPTNKWEAVAPSPRSGMGGGGAGGGWFEDKGSSNKNKRKNRLQLQQQQGKRRGFQADGDDYSNNNEESFVVSSAEKFQRDGRADRFKDDARFAKRKTTAPSVLLSAAAMHNDGAIDTDFDPEKLKIVGTCQTIEKSYFRLTSAPDPATVRPEPVLALTLNHLKSKWRARFDDPPPRGGSGPVEYIWLCDQLKALRQDLVVQHVKNEFTIGVYECHARVALEEGDMNEYNQCQTQLRDLYRDPELVRFGCRSEFTAYRILYYLYLQGNKKYAEGSSDLLGILRELRAGKGAGGAVVGLGQGSGVLESEEVQNALGLLRALAGANWVAFWRLADSAPHMGSYILDYMLPKCRLQALRTLLRAYKPSLLPIPFVARMLHFVSDDDNGDDDNGDGGDGGGSSGSSMSDENQQSCADCLVYLQAAGVAVVGLSSDGGKAEQVAWSEVAVDTKASAGKPLDLEAIAAYEGTSGTLL